MKLNKYEELDTLATAGIYMDIPTEEDIAYTIAFRKMCQRYNINIATADDYEKEFVMSQAERAVANQIA